MNRTRNCSEKQRVLKQEFRKKTLMKDNWLAKTRNFFGRCLVSLTLMAGGLSLTSCEQPNLQQQTGVVNRSAITNEEGRATFELGEREYQFNFYDFETYSEIPNLLVLLSMKNGNGVYTTIDLEDRYFSRTGGVEPDESEGAFRVSNTVMQRRDPPCEITIRSLEHYTEGKLPQTLYEELYPENGSNEDIGNSTLAQQFHIPHGGERVELAELDDFLGILMDLSINEAVGQGIETTAIRASVLLGIKNARAVTGPIGLLLLEMDLCATWETISWAEYYRGLCYEETDTFQIWKVNNILQGIQDFSVPIEPLDVEINLLSNPVFVILPTERDEPNWDAPLASIDGRVFGAPIYGSILATLEHIPSRIPTLSHRTLDREFFLSASACESYNPTYELRVSTTSPGLGEPSTIFEALEGETYEIDYYLSTGDNGLYRSFFRDVGDGTCDRLSIAVSREEIPGYLNEEQCEGEQEGCFYVSDEVHRSWGDIDGEVILHGEGDLAVYTNITTGERHQIEGDSECAILLDRNSRISGNFITLNGGESGDDLNYYNLCIYNMQEGMLQLVDTGWNWDIDGNRVVIKRRRISETDQEVCQFRLIDVLSGEVTDIPFPDEYSDVDIHRNAVSNWAFQGSRLAAILTNMERESSLWYFDVDEGYWEQISNYREINEMSVPIQIFGDRIVFNDDAGGTQRGSIFVHSIVSGITSELPLYDYWPQTAETVHIWGNRIAFRDWSMEMIYTMDLSNGEVHLVATNGGWPQPILGISQYYLAYRSGDYESSNRLHACPLDEE